MEDDRFEETLAQGLKAEDYVYEWLKQNYAFVQDCRYQRTADKNKGPRLEGQSGSVIIPDFIIYDRFLGNVAVDVKSKSSIYPVKGKKCFTVDSYKYEHYKRCVQLMRLDRLVVIFLFEGRIYWYNDTDVLDEKHVFGNVYGDSAYLFEYNEGKIKR